MRKIASLIGRLTVDAIALEFLHHAERAAIGRGRRLYASRQHLFTR